LLKFKQKTGYQMLPYAESFLEIAGSNQWFVRFFVTHDLSSVKAMIDQKQWLIDQSLTLTEVRTHEFDLPSTNFYHVSFSGPNDPRLDAYLHQFEDENGNSRNPNHYQMYEWSYNSWVECGQRERWLASISHQG
jgi:hypothetical protein